MKEMNLKVKTLHELLTLSLWLGDRIDIFADIKSHYPTLKEAKKQLDYYAKLYMGVNEEIDLRLSLPEDTYNHKSLENDHRTRTGSW